jgi:hypothetical protein
MSFFVAAGEADIRLGDGRWFAVASTKARKGKKDEK